MCNEQTIYLTKVNAYQINLKNSNIIQKYDIGTLKTILNHLIILSFTSSSILILNHDMCIRVKVK